jgi:hypothetical protein
LKWAKFKLGYPQTICPLFWKSKIHPNEETLENEARKLIIKHRKLIGLPTI